MQLRNGQLGRGSSWQRSSWGGHGMPCHGLASGFAHLVREPTTFPPLHPLPQARASLLGALDPAVAAAQEAAAAAGLQQLPGYQPGAPMPMPFPGMTAGGAPPGAGGA